jgi:hypothetical protein
LVTRRKATPPDREYLAVVGAREPKIADVASSEERESVRQSLTERFLQKGDHAPSEDDVSWGVLNRKLLCAGKHGDVDERAIRFMMAEFLARRRCFADAMCQYLMVCSLDLDDAGSPFLAPAPLDQIARIARILGLSEGDVHAEYSERCRGRHVSDAIRWSVLKEGIWPPPSALRKPVKKPGSLSREPKNNEVEQEIRMPDGRTERLWRDGRVFE